MSTSTTSTEMRREIGEDSPDVLSAGSAARSRNRTSVVVKEAVHSAGEVLTRSLSPEGADFGSQSQSWLSCNQRAKVTAKALQEKASEERAIQETGTGRS